MADFPEALEKALSGHYGVPEGVRSPLGSKRGFQARARALERAYGSQKGAARAAGVSPDTWSKWKRGVQSPGPASQGKVGSAYTALLRAARVARGHAPGSFSIQATVRCTPTGPAAPRLSAYYNGGSATATAAYRWFRAQKLTGSQIDRVVSAWAAGKSPDDVAAQLVTEISRAYPGRFDFEGTNVTVIAET